MAKLMKYFTGRKMLFTGFLLWYGCAVFRKLALYPSLDEN